MSGVMLGAIATELFVESGRWPLPSVLFVLALVVAWGRRDWTFGIWQMLRPRARPSIR